MPTVSDRLVGSVLICERRVAGSKQRDTSLPSPRVPEQGTYSLQIRISLVILLIVAAFALCAEYLDRHYLHQLARETFRAESASILHQIDGRIRSRSALQNLPLQQRYLSELVQRQPGLVALRLYEVFPEGATPPSLLAQAGESADPQAPEPVSLIGQMLVNGGLVSNLDVRDQQHRMGMAAPIKVRDHVIGAVYAEFWTAPFDTVLSHHYRWSLTLRLVAGAMIVIAINLFLYLAMHRPLRRLSLAIDAVAQGQYTAAVPADGKHEIATLGRQFNSMVETIRATIEENRRLYDELKGAHQGLEARIEEATKELRGKNEELARINALLGKAQREAARAQRLSVLGQVVATVAHKIGTPLTALSGHIQLLAEEERLEPEARRRIQTIEAQIDRASRIIKDLLGYPRRPDPLLIPVEINVCVEETAVLFKPVMDRQHVTLHLKLDPAICPVVADLQQLQEVYSALIDNALDAMPQGGTLLIRTYHSDEVIDPGQPPRGWVGIDFTDTGQGIDPTHLPSIFEPFFTTKTAGEGTGLGLTIARDTIRGLGGRIVAASERSRGTTITILLPEGDTGT